MYRIILKVNLDILACFYCFYLLMINVQHSNGSKYLLRFMIKDYVSLKIVIHQPTMAYTVADNINFSFHVYVPLYIPCVCVCLSLHP